MAHFLLYIPSERVLKNVQDTFESIGLRDLFEGSEQRLIEKGPDGKPGTLCAWRKPGELGFHYDEAAQSWSSAAQSGEMESGRYWIGVWNDKPPKPADLQRPYPLSGRYMTLGDGNKWLIPALTELPKSAILMDDGSVRFEVQRKHHALWLERESWMPSLTHNEPFDEAEMMRFLSRCLRINYRITDELTMRRVGNAEETLLWRSHIADMLTTILTGLSLDEFKRLEEVKS